MAENRVIQARGLMSVIKAAQGRLRVENGRLFCGPQPVAERFAKRITEYKAEIMTLLSEPELRSFKQLVLESIRAGICPDCGYKLDLQSKNHGVVWFCSGCRQHLVEGDFDDSDKGDKAASL